MTTDSAATASEAGPGGAPPGGPGGTGLGERAQSGGDLAGDIGRRLAAHRGQRGMRVAELAREVGVTPSLISQIERGMSRPSVSTLFAIAQALDVPVDAFFREPQPPPVAAGRPGRATAAARPPGRARWRRPTAVMSCAGAAGR
jgi:transcriptional regulator with XRE-family HTH domain